jgi:C-terminal processing protease CtpA/Prc
MEVSTIGAFQKVITRRPSKPAFFLDLKRGDQSFRVPLGRQLTLMGMTLFPDSADRPIVAAVDPKSPAGYAGFQVGDMIAGFDHQLTATMNGILDFGIPFIRDMQQGQGIGFDVIRGGKQMKLSVTRPADADLPLLTSEQERHLHRLANGDDIRPQQQRSRGIKTGQLPGPMFP